MMLFLTDEHPLTHLVKMSVGGGKLIPKSTNLEDENSAESLFWLISTGGRKSKCTETQDDEHLLE